MGILVYGIHKVLLTQNGSLAHSRKNWKILIYKNGILRSIFHMKFYIVAEGSCDNFKTDVVLLIAPMIVVKYFRKKKKKKKKKRI